MRKRIPLGLYVCIYTDADEMWRSNPALIEKISRANDLLKKPINFAEFYIDDVRKKSQEREYKAQQVLWENSPASTISSF